MQRLFIVLILLSIIISTSIAQEGIPTFEEVPSTVKDFLANSDEYPFGKKHELAPGEIEHIGKLAGMWYCDVFINKNGSWVKGKPAIWTFKYTLDGFAIEDLWYKTLENSPPFVQSLGHDFSGVNVRLYDPYSKEWKAMWFTNAITSDTTNTLVNTYTATSTDEEFVMMRDDLRGAQRAKITFHNMQEKYFDWKNEVSSDSGKTWKVSFRIEGRKIK